MSRFTIVSVMVFAIVTVLAASAVYASDDSGYSITFPLGIDGDALVVPEDNPMSAAKVELGKLLYFDARLSVDATVSCATCHDPAKGFTDQAQFSSGFKRQKGGRNAPTVINSAFNYFQFWDGRSPSLEDQAKGPIENPVEMANTLEAAAATIAGVDGYAAYFAAAFGDDGVTIERIAKAIATYERTILSGNSAWDRYVYAKDQNALSEAAKRGLELFEGKALCTRCHVGFNLTDGLFHNIGVGMGADEPDLGRYGVSKEEKDKGAFKTPVLRDLLKTAPYMHDGSVKTLEEVVEFYDRGGEANKWLDAKIVKLGLTAEEKADLVEFLKSLEGDLKEAPPRSLPQ